MQTSQNLKVVTEQGWLGKLLASFGLGPKQVEQTQTKFSTSGAMTKDAYLLLLDSIQNYERDIPMYLAGAVQLSVLDDDQREIVNTIRRMSSRKQITPKKTAANLIVYVNEFCKRVKIKLAAKSQEDREILDRKRKGLVTRVVQSRIHTNANVIQFAEHLINEFSARMANLARVPSRVNVAHRAKEKARIQAIVQEADKDLTINSQKEKKRSVA